MQFILKNKTAELVGWHPVHLMREAKAGRFPAPVQIGPNSVGFVEEEVLAWMENKIQRRDAATETPNHERKYNADKVQP